LRLTRAARKCKAEQQFAPKSRAKKRRTLAYFRVAFASM
jgi:hypothetical protein